MTTSERELVEMIETHTILMNIRTKDAYNHCPRLEKTGIEHKKIKRQR